MAEPTTEVGETKHEVDPSSDNINGAQQAPDVSVKDAATTTASAENAPKVAAVCKKHPDPKNDGHKKKKKRKSKKKKQHHEAAESSSSESSSSSSSSSSDSDSAANSASDSEEADSDSADTESDAGHRKRQRLRAKARAKRAQRDKKKNKKKRKTKSRKAAQPDSESESSSDSDSKSSESDDEGDSAVDEKALRKLVARLKLQQKRGKRLRDQANDSLGGLDPLGDGRRDKKSRKKKPASKVAFKRVDQREFQFDSLIFSYLIHLY
jgi:hypothetical protein